MSIRMLVSPTMREIAYHNGVVKKNAAGPAHALFSSITD